MVVWWGPQLLMLYNDAWQLILGDTKHPAGLGRPGQESWPETWPVVGVQFENALQGRRELVRGPAPRERPPRVPPGEVQG